MKAKEAIEVIKSNYPTSGYEQLKEALDVAINALEKVAENEEISEERWEAAINHARFMLEEYKKIPTGAFGAMGIANDIARYENGERTKELLEALEGIN